MTAAEKTRQSYDRRPYPGEGLRTLIKRGGALPSFEWMLALGRTGQNKPGRVLVAGCGLGVEAFVLRKQLPEAEIVAVDFSARSIAEAKRIQRADGRAKPIRFLVADLTDPALAKKTGDDFDLITCHGVLSYIQDTAQALSNLAANLSPDGALYLGVNGEAHTSTRLRPWLASFGCDVTELSDERRLRELLKLWDSQQDAEARPLASMPTSYLAGDVCGPHFNNWSLAQWRSAANTRGLELAATWLLPIALRLALEDDRNRPLLPSAVGLLAERLDQARPAGFHKLLFRRAPGTAEDGGGLKWTGLYRVRVADGKSKGTRRVFLTSQILGLNAEFKLKATQIEPLRRLVGTQKGSAVSSDLSWQNDEARIVLSLWEGLGAVARSRS